MPNHRNAAWRKPVPKMIPEVPPYSPIDCPSQTAPQYSMHHFADDEKPPLPPKWDPTLERALRYSSKRNAVYVPSPSDMDEGWDADNSSLSHETTIRLPRRARARPGSLASRHVSVRRSRFAQTAHVTHEHMPIHSLPQDYRPPTPPLPRKRQRRVDKSSIQIQPGTFQKSSVHHAPWTIINSENTPSPPPSYTSSLLPDSTDYANAQPLHPDYSVVDECWGLPHLLNPFSGDIPAYTKNASPQVAGRGHLLGSVRTLGGCLRNKLSDAFTFRSDLTTSRFPQKA